MKKPSLPTISIITPSYNQGKFIRETIDSVLSQNYPNLEYWVIDGGSTDDTVKILKSYGDKINWVSEKDGGQTEAINKQRVISTSTISSIGTTILVCSLDSLHHRRHLSRPPSRSIRIDSF